jgi:CheY-like chemotaxis protein
MLINRDFDETDGDELNSLIDANGKALLQLINDIIDISKIEAGHLKIFKDAFPLNDCIDNIISIYRKQVDQNHYYKKIEILSDIQSQKIIVFTDKLRIEQILKNLINNAIKFTKEGSITVGYKIEKKSKQDYIRFFVKDTGIGIPEDELKTIFDRFIKSESKENILYGGTGLGLSISSNLAKLLGGTMWVESKVDIGSTFFFEIPLDEVKEYKSEKPAKEEYREYNWEEKTVLIVENEHANFLVLQGILKFTNVNIIHFKDGQLAVDMFTSNNENSIDLILMDIKMPRLNGIEAAKKIKALNKTIPIIAQTAYAMDHEEKLIIQSGFDGYIAKPIVPKLLINKMAVFLD